MATPTNDSYSAASGQTLYAGRSGLPSWVTSVAVNAWGVVPLSNSWSSLDPKLDAALNPSYPASAPWSGSNGFGALISAWCGGVSDGAGQWWNVIGTGHSDGADNALYKLDLRLAAPLWSRLSAPSGALPGAITLNDGQEATGVFSDGRARPGHSRNSVMHIPSRGLLWAQQSGSSFSGAAGSGKPVYVDKVTGAHTIINSGYTQDALRAAVYDPTRDCVYTVYASTTNTLMKFDCTTQVWSAMPGTRPSAGHFSLTYLPGYDCLLAAGDSTYGVYDLVTQTWSTPTVTGTGALATGANGSDGYSFGDSPHVWVASLGAVLAWNNSANTTLVTKLTPGADPRTSWTRSTMPVSGSNAVTPSVCQVNGTYGRWFDWPAANCMLLINGQGSSDVYFYRYG